MPRRSLRAMVKAVKIPVTVSMRKGWTTDDYDCTRRRQARRGGCWRGSGDEIHGRTAKQSHGRHRGLGICQARGRTACHSSRV